MNEIKVFEQFKEIRAGFTFRGKTALQLKDEMSETAAREGRFLASLGLIHSTEVLQLDDLSSHELYVPGRYWVHNCDGGVTQKKGICINVTSGDCLALFVYDPVKKAVGLAHAGWRGTLDGMAEALILKMYRTYGCDPQDMYAYIGPGIGLCCFEVSEDVAEEFTDKYPWAEDYMIDLGMHDDGTGLAHKYKIDLKGINLELFEMLGVGHSEASPLCTCCRPDMFYSYRRSKEKDRMLAYIELTE